MADRKKKRRWIGVTTYPDGRKVVQTSREFLAGVLKKIRREELAEARGRKG